MSTFSFGEYIDGKPYKVLNERRMRASAGIMFLFGLIATINGFVLHKYVIIPYVMGGLVINFLIGLFINPKFSPTVLLAWIFVRKQTPIPIGAVQKKFAWSIGLLLSSTIFVLSLFLQNDGSLFHTVCPLCMLCLLMLYLETAFAICVGCKVYDIFIRVKILPKPKERPNCMGDSCDVKK
ncbi:MAG TPA: DUF4395 domain-containing protein [Bacteroidales bacterium]|nr:DUF4395 domain-containing protein [Bacteroidales bacterium]HPS17240.1 DUF4395 domain-containing protein [Bacteroidales bacterium]